MIWCKCLMLCLHGFVQLIGEREVKGVVKLKFHDITGCTVVCSRILQSTQKVGNLWTLLRTLYQLCVQYIDSYLHPFSQENWSREHWTHQWRRFHALEKYTMTNYDRIVYHMLLSQFAIIRKSRSPVAVER